MALDSNEHAGQIRFCCVPPETPNELPKELDPNRASAIYYLQNKWVNGTVLHYWFFDEANTLQKDVVRRAFAYWQERVGLRFVEANKRGSAELRIGFDQNDGSWSYIGTYNLKIPNTKRTMNFGWDLTTAWGWATALHEIGHALGMPHEHQNSLAGIVWDEEKVYAEFKASQGWSREEIYRNIIRKIPANEIQGTKWDPKSIMHYSFKPGLIKAPRPYDTDGISENYQPSERDLAFISELYPKAVGGPTALRVLSVERVTASNGGQQDFSIEPENSRYYTIQTVGKSDAKMVLFELIGGERVYVSADDNSGGEEGSTMRVRLFSGRKYILSLRVHYIEHPDGMGVLLV